MRKTLWSRGSLGATEILQKKLTMNFFLFIHSILPTLILLLLKHTRHIPTLGSLHRQRYLWISLPQISTGQLSGFRHTLAQISPSKCGLP